MGPARTLHPVLSNTAEGPLDADSWLLASPDAATPPWPDTELSFVDSAQQQGAGGVGATQAVQEDVCGQQLGRDVQQLQGGGGGARSAGA